MKLVRENKPIFPFCILILLTEKSLVHNLFIEMANPDQMSYAPVNRPKDSVSMEDTKLKNLIICHPEVMKSMFPGK